MKIKMEKRDKEIQELREEKQSLIEDKNFEFQNQKKIVEDKNSEIESPKALIEAKEV